MPAEQQSYDSSVGVWFVLGVIWFALAGQSRLVLSPEEAFAMEKARR
jgi:ethanolamine permease